MHSIVTTTEFTSQQVEQSVVTSISQKVEHYMVTSNDLISQQLVHSMVTSLNIASALHGDLHRTYLTTAGAFHGDLNDLPLQQLCHGVTDLTSQQLEHSMVTSMIYLYNSCAMVSLISPHHSWSTPW